jgi:hypothetical protein
LFISRRNRAEGKAYVMMGADSRWLIGAAVLFAALSGAARAQNPSHGQLGRDESRAAFFLADKNIGSATSFSYESMFAAQNAYGAYIYANFALVIGYEVSQFKLAYQYSYYANQYAFQAYNHIPSGGDPTSFTQAYLNTYHAYVDLYYASLGL